MVAPFIPHPLPPKGFSVDINDIHANFMLFGFLPFVNSHNSLSPRLVLHDTQLEVKVIRTDFYEYNTISQADYLPNRFLASARVLLELPTHNVSFLLYLPTARAEKALLEFLQARGTVLTAAAAQHVAS